MTETLQPPTLPKLAAEEATALNALIGTGRVLAFTWAGQPAELRFSAVAEAPQPSGYLKALLGPHALTIGYLELPEPSSLGVEFAGLEAAGLPPDLRLAVTEALLAEPLALLTGAGATLTITGWHEGKAPPAPRLGWEIRREGRRFLSGTLHLDGEAFNALAGLAARTAPRPVRSADATPVTFGVAVAHLALPLRHLAGVAAGDVLLPGLSLRDWEAGRCTLWAGAVRIGDAVRQQANVRILSMNPTQVAPPTPAAAAQLNVDDLPVQLQFEVSQLEITVGQLRTLAPGYSFDLPQVPDRQVAIRANGREVGTGELVQLGENLGVRIVSWNLA